MLAERWILAVPRHPRFAALSQVRDAVAPLLEALNARTMRQLGRSRRQLFEELERGALKPLPQC